MVWQEIWFYVLGLQSCKLCCAKLFIISFVIYTVQCTVRVVWVQNYAHSLVNFCFFFQVQIFQSVKTGDISRDSSRRGWISENQDCPRKSGMSGHPSLPWHCLAEHYRTTVEEVRCWVLMFWRVKHHFIGYLVTAMFKMRLREVEKCFMSSWNKLPKSTSSFTVNISTLSISYIYWWMFYCIIIIRYYCSYEG